MCDVKLIVKLQKTLSPIQLELSFSDKEIEEKVKKIMDSENVYKIYLNAKQLWILQYSWKRQ